MNLAIIPARGGSKRIPRKNIRTFAGRPIIAYSIEAAISSGLFQRIVVSTDDAEIARIAVDCGAEVPFVRPADLSNDYATTAAVIKHAIGWHEERGFDVGYACCIYATAPFIQSRYLHEGFEKLVASGKSFAFSVTSFPFPIQRALRIGADGCVRAANPEYANTRSQDLEDFYHDAGQFYWGTASAFMHDVTIFSSESVAVVLPRHLVQDIDTQEDWRRAELMHVAIDRRTERLS